MSARSRVLALCADDFGLSAPISTAITDLVQHHRLSSVSCITNAENFATAAASLYPHLEQVEVGLHFNLTEGQPLSPALAAHWPELPSVGRLILRAHMGAIPHAAIQHELEAQWQAFHTAFGKEPDFIDGHLHIHDLPIIRELVLEKARAQHNIPWVRNTGNIAGSEYNFKRIMIELTGGRALQWKMRELKLFSNSVLIGVYNFDVVDYRALMQGWLQQLPEKGGLILCHPGHIPPTEVTLSHGSARATEYRYFASDEFLQDLHAAQVQLQPLSQQG
jgi:chitin disaccharide deacetylase